MSRNSIESFIDYLSIERGLSPNTLQAYRRDLCQFRDWLKKEFLQDGPIPGSIFL
ncbi:unnamed protein product, partial [marine sediment metagenome]